MADAGVRGGSAWSLIAGGVLVVAALCGSVVLGAASPAPLPESRQAPGPPAQVEVPATALVAASTVIRPDAAWVATVAGRTGIPPRALEAYALADLVIDAEQPGCGIGWNTLAGIGAIESDHGRHDGSVLGVDGYPVPAIRGGALDGNGVAAIADSDGGAWDGDAVWDRAVGPLQFIPETWSHWGADANGDGRADPNQMDDAALAAARYLCASGEMTTATGWRAAIFSYNHLDVYVDDVATVAQRYASAG